jgi:hypothetical protein
MTVFFSSNFKLAPIGHGRLAGKYRSAEADELRGAGPDVGGGAGHEVGGEYKKKHAHVFYEKDPLYKSSCKQTSM